MRQKGIEFVEELYQKYGLLEAHKHAMDYLRCPVKNDDEDELEFRDGVRYGIWKLEQI